VADYSERILPRQDRLDRMVLHGLLRRTLAAVALACTLLCALPGCRLPPVRTTGRSHDIEFLAEDLRPEVLRTHLHEFTLIFTGVVEKTADRISAEAAAPGINRNALRWKIQAVPEAQLAGLRMEPVAGLLDLWTFCEQMHSFFASGAGRDVFGAHQELAVEASDRLRQDMSEVARTAVVPDEFEATERMIVEWAAKHPLESLIFARESIIPDFADRSKRSEDVFGSMGTIEDVAIAGEMSIAVLAASLPRQARWQAELLLHETLRGEEVGTLLDTAARTSELMTNVPELVDEVVASLQETAAIEREAAVAALRVERALVLADVERQRIETVDVLGEELRALRELITAEREAALRGADALTVRTVGTVEERLVLALDRLVLRLALVVLAGLVLLPFALRIGRRIAFGPQRGSA